VRKWVRTPNRLPRHGSNCVLKDCSCPFGTGGRNGNTEGTRARGRSVGVALLIFTLVVGVLPHTINDLLATYGYAAVFLFIAIESVGIPFPGETASGRPSPQVNDGCSRARTRAHVRALPPPR
jgi:hypothetical protein